MDGKVCVCFLMISMVSSFSLQQTKDPQVLDILKPAYDASAGMELGILKPADVTSAGMFPSYIMDLLPEIMAASTKIKSNDVVDTLMAYMPFAHKIMAGQSPNGKLTVEQENLLRFTERVVPPMMRFVEGISGGSSLNDLPLNATPDDNFINIMLKMLPDISAVINQLKLKYGGWPGTYMAVEITNAFMPLARKAMLYQAELEGCQITEEEDAYLTFAERVVPSVMEYSQALYYNSVQPGQEYEIGQLVKSAVEDLHKLTNKFSKVPLARINYEYDSEENEF